MDEEKEEKYIGCSWCKNLGKSGLCNLSMTNFGICKSGESKGPSYWALLYSHLRKKNNTFVYALWEPTWMDTTKFLLSEDLFEI